RTVPEPGGEQLVELLDGLGGDRLELLLAGDQAPHVAAVGAVGVEAAVLGLGVDVVEDGEDVEGSGLQGWHGDGHSFASSSQAARELRRSAQSRCPRALRSLAMRRSSATTTGVATSATSSSVA